MLFVVLNRL